MNRTRFFCLIFSLLLLSLFFMPDKKIHSNYKYQDINEHLDIHFKWPKVKIMHLISDREKNIVLSENLGGFYYRNPFTGSYNIIITNRNHITKNEVNAASLNQQDVVSACIYNVNKNVIIFFDETRGGVKINDKNINLSSLFLGNETEFHCLNDK